MMYFHAPEGYQCPLCYIVASIAKTGIDESPHTIVLHNEVITVLVPRHYWVNKGNVIIIPNAHYENLYDIDYRLGNAFLLAAQQTARVMKSTFSCHGVSSRQHNEPAGYQDVWHFHMHLFPRYEGDNLYAGHKTPYEDTERLCYAARLRDALDA